MSVITSLSLQPNLKPLTSFRPQNPSLFFLKRLTIAHKISTFTKPTISFSLQVKAKPPVSSDELPLDASPSESSSDKEVSFPLVFVFLYFFFHENWV